MPLGKSGQAADEEAAPELVLGVKEDEDWAHAHLQPGICVYDRDTLLNAVVRGRLEPLGKPLFVVGGAGASTGRSPINTRPGRRR